MGVWEEANDDTLKAMYMLSMSTRLQGNADEDGTQRYYNLSQYGEIDNLNVHHDNFKTPCHNEKLRISSVGFGTYMGEPDDETDFKMYNAIK